MAASIKERFLDSFQKKSAPAVPKGTPATKPVTPETLVPQIRVVFMGTPPLAQELLQSMVETGYNIVGVVTKPDTPVGRKQLLSESPVKAFALSKNLTVLSPNKLDALFFEQLKDLKPDLILIAAYGKILAQKILDLPGLGCLNVHYSLLPRFRGASPIQNALLFGDTETGVTLMKMDAGLDTGDIIATQKITIHPDDTTTTLTAKLNTLAKEVVLKNLPLWVKQKIQSVPQPHEGVVLCQLIERADGKIEWSDSAQNIYNRYRAFDPWPGVFTFWKKDDSFVRMKLTNIGLHTSPTEQKYSMGEVFQLADVVGVQTGAGIILLHTVQPEGKAPMLTSDFVRGNPNFIGAFLV